MDRIVFDVYNFQIYGAIVMLRPEDQKKAAVTGPSASMTLKVGKRGHLCVTSANDVPMSAVVTVKAFYKNAQGMDVEVPGVEMLGAVRRVLKNKKIAVIGIKLKKGRPLVEDNKLEDPPETGTISITLSTDPNPIPVPVAYVDDDEMVP